MLRHEIHKNMRLREACRIADKLGCVVRLNSAGEHEFTHRVWNRRFRIHYGRHDTPQIVVSALRNLFDKLAETAT